MGHSNCNASLSQPNAQKNSRAHLRGSLFNFSESGRGRVGEGRGYNYYIYALRLLDYMGFALKEKRSGRLGGGGGGGTHSSPQPWDWG